MNTRNRLKNWPVYVLTLLMGLAALYYAKRINYKFIDTLGDNYTYELFAQSVFTSQPFKINIKFDYYDDLPINHHQRSFPPLYPILLAVAHLLFGGSMYVNIYLTGFFAILCAVPVYHLGKLLGGDRTGLLAALLTLFNYTLVEMSLLAMSEPLFCLLSLYGLYYFVLYEHNQNKSALVLAGFFASLAYLTRFNGAAAIMAAVFYLLIKNGLRFDKTNRQRAARELFTYLAPAFTIAFPWFLRNYLVFGDPFYYVGRLYVKFFVGTAPSQTVMNQYLLSLLEHFKLVWREATFLNLLAITSFILIKNKRRIIGAIWLFAGFNFLMSIFHPVIVPRHVINYFPAVYLLAALCLTALNKEFLDRLPLKKIGRRLVQVTVAVAFLVGALKSVYHGLTFTKNIDFFSSHYAYLGDMLQTYSPPGAVVMTNMPPAIAFYARRPTIMLPKDATEEKFDQYVREYNVDFFVSVGYTGYVPANFEKKWSRLLHDRDNLYYIISVYQRTS